MPNSNFGVSTYSYTLTHTAGDCLDELAEAGFTDFELVMYPGHAWPSDMSSLARADLKRSVDALGARINSLNQPNLDINLAAATPEMRKYSFRAVQGMVEMAGDLEVPWVVIGPGKVNPLLPASRESATGHLHRALDRLIRVAEQVGTRVLIENMPFAFLPDAESLTDAISGYRRDELGMVYDVANGAFIKEDIRAGLQRMGDRLDLIHVSDTPMSVYKHDPVGEGDMDFAAIARDLEAIGWQRKPLMEIVSVSPDPKRELAQSVGRLQACGWATSAVE